ncbi:MAG: altronate dehydratase family protein, partial [Cyclobacteriaceae bacterium]|nr:altronate dehydratase family protein [Cyclobacteriaceae bacterium]
MKNNYLKIHPDDNVAVALQNLEKGDFIFHEKERISLITPIPAKGKVALIDFSIGDFIFMYGIIVGKATTFISRGEWLGVHNVIHEVSSLSEWKEPFQWTPPTENRWENKYFMGYHRADGSVGTANHWLVIPLVFCENRNVLMLKEAFDLHLGFRVKNPYEKLVEKLVHNLKQGDSRSLSRSDISEEVESDKVFKNISGIKFLTHDGGCGGTREDSEMLCRLIAGYIANPNVGGATILSLGCQHAQIHLLKEILQEVYPRHQKPVLYFEQQKYPSETVMMQEIIEQTFEEVKKLNSMERKPAPLSQLVMGVECGGSDGFSGLSANPSMGYCADLLVMNGGSVILSEFPELCGVEQDFVNRSLSGEIAKKFVNLMRNYDERAKSVGSGFDMNPSPGNIKDGLITDAIKSAGAAKKGGTSPVVDV